MNVIHSAATHRHSTVAAKKLIYPAAERNKDPLLGVLRQFIRPGSNQTFLEVASGSGQHLAHFAPHFPQVTFYPSEYESGLLESITSHANGFQNIHQPLQIDITTDFSTWGNGIFKERSLDYIFNANMIHITPYQCCISLFKNAGKLLKPNGLLFTYGPYAINGKIIPESNISFHNSLRLQTPEWGLRDLKDIEKLAVENGIQMLEIIDMPANNKTIVWKKD